MDLRLCILQLSVLFAVINAQDTVIWLPDNDICKTIANEDGVCVYQYQCLNGVINVNGENIIDVRRAGDGCGEYLLECCKDLQPGDAASGGESGTNNGTVPSESEDATLIPPTDSAGVGEENSTDQTVPESTTPAAEKHDPPKQGLPASTTQATNTEGTSATKKPLKPPSLMVPAYELEGCGHRNPHGVLFTIENNVHSETEYGEYPWAAAVFVRQENGTLKYLCGGALIDQAAILTTASCLYGYRAKVSQIVVRLGEWDMSTLREPIPHVDSEAENVYLHPEHGVTSNVNDIAIVILRETVELGHTIGVVCLPSANQVPTRGDLVGAGWGNVPSFVVPKKLPQTILKKTHLQYVSNSECQTTMRRLIGRKFTLHQSFICARAIDTEMLPCRGDSGSPFMVEIKGSSNRFYLAGLSTWGYDCNKQSAPTVLTNVAYHRHWIDGIMKKENLNSWSYTYQPNEVSAEE